MPYLANYAPALRSIGQALEKNNIDVFEIKNQAAEFRLECGDPNPPYLNLIRLKYSLNELEVLEHYGRARRGKSDVQIDFSSLPEILRALGKYIDSKSGHLIRLSNHECNAPFSVQLDYETRDRRLHSEELSTEFVLRVCTRMYQNRRPGASSRSGIFLSRT
jgi:hypothetical protein